MQILRCRDLLTHYIVNYWLIKSHVLKSAFIHWPNAAKETLEAIIESYISTQEKFILITQEASCKTMLCPCPKQGYQAWELKNTLFAVILIFKFLNKSWITV